MKHPIKRILSLLLCACLLLSVMPVMALAAGTRTIYFDNSGKKWNNINVYTWNAAGTCTGEWPGSAMTLVEGGIYSYEVPTDAVNVIFNNGSGAQTGDLTLPTDGKDLYNGSVWGTYGSGEMEEPDYCLVGFINGANYGCEEDHQNVGEYVFADGKLTTTFAADSYIFIKTTDNSKWFLAEKYCTDTICRFQEGGSEKMFVPGNVELTFTLTVNADGALWLKYETVSTECSHDYRVTETEAPSCTVGGKEIWTCSECGDWYTVILGATGHTYTAKVTTAATCTKTGVKTFTCKCGDSYTEVIPATGHNYVNSKCTVCGKVDPNCTHSYTSEITIAPTCEAEGVRTYTCGRCGDVYTEAIAATGHTYVDIIVPPSCELNGWTRHVCEDCGAALSNTDVVNPVGHDYSTVVTPPTCTEKGYTTYTCSRCGNVYTWNETPATGHSFQFGRCSGCGLVCDHVWQEGVCGKCGSACGHKWSNGTCLVCELVCGHTNWVDGACTACKLTCSHNYANGKCTVCGLMDPDAEPVFYLVGYINGANYGCEEDAANMGEYQFVDGKLVVTFEQDSYVFLKTEGNAQWYMAKTYGEGPQCIFYPTSTGASEKMYAPGGTQLTFTLVEDYNGAYLLRWATPQMLCPHLNHDIDGICTQCGHQLEHHYVEGVCSCGKTEPAQQVVEYYLFGWINGANYGCEEDAANMGIYKFVDGKLTATFDQDSYVGVKTTGNADWFMCNGNVNDYAVSRLYNTSTLGNPGKLKVPGHVKVTFTLEVNWDKTLTLSYVQDASACAHEYNSIITTPEGCESDGVMTDICVKCGDSYTKVIPAKGHQYSWKPTEDPTCTADGMKTYTCTVCGDSYTEAIPSLGHSFVNGKCTLCGASDDAVGTTATYYLVGYINGADYGCNDDWENMGEYKFVDGKLTAKFDTDSYVFLKTGDNGRWLLADSYCTDTVCTFREGSTEKLFVPGGMQLLFNLTENADGTVTVGYTAVSTTPSVVPTLTLKYPTVSFEDMILMNVYYAVDNMEDVVDMGLVTYETKPAAANVATADEILSGYTLNSSDGFYFSTTNGIAPKDLGDNIYFAIYAKLADGTYAYSKVATYSPKTYANSLLSTGTAEMKALVVAMLNYGAAAQKYFNYNTGSLMNAALTSAQKKLVASYSDSMITAVTQPSGTKVSNFVNDKTYLGRYPTISFEGAFCINYYFQPSLAVKGDVTMYVWSAEDYSKASVLTKANATDVVKMTATASGEYLGVVEGIAAKDLDKVVYVAFIYNDGTTEHCGGVVAYSIGAYCKSQAATTGTLSDLAKACAVYGYYAKQLFG